MRMNDQGLCEVVYAVTNTSIWKYDENVGQDMLDNLKGMNGCSKKKKKEVSRKCVLRLGRSSSGFSCFKSDVSYDDS